MKKFLLILSVLVLAGCDSLEYQVAIDGMCDDTFDQGRVICQCVQETLKYGEPTVEFQRAFVALVDGDTFGVDADAVEEVRQIVAQLYMVCASETTGY